ncbi:MAG: hypothetical protein WBG48_01815, partial [Pricia sp.]
MNNSKKRKRIASSNQNSLEHRTFNRQKTFHSNINENKDSTISSEEIDYEDLEDKWYVIKEDYMSNNPNLTKEDVNVEP